MARHPQPNNVRDMKGCIHKDRYLPDGVPVDSVEELPDHPDWWDIRVIKFYQEKGALLIDNKMLTPLDFDYFFKFCWLSVKIDRLCEAGETPSMSMYTQHDKYSAKLGMTFVDRQKIKAPETSKKGNKFAKIQKKSKK